MKSQSGLNNFIHLKFNNGSERTIELFIPKKEKWNRLLEISNYFQDDLKNFKIPYLYSNKRQQATLHRDFTLLFFQYSPKCVIRETTVGIIHSTAFSSDIWNYAGAGFKAQ